MALKVKEQIGSIHPSRNEPAPIWPDAPRYAPTERFPTYRYVKGQNPHPYRNEDGHSYGREITISTPLTLENWNHHQEFFWGIDLYHQGFFWESCVAWESLLQLSEADGYVANFLQGLMLNSTAMLKYYVGDLKGTLMKSQAARWRMARILYSGYNTDEDLFMGINVPILIKEIEQFYSPCWTATDSSSALTGDPPRLEVKLDY